MSWILIAVITTIHLQGGVKAVSVMTHDFESRAVCEQVAKQIKLELAGADVLDRVRASILALRNKQEKIMLIESLFFVGTWFALSVATGLLFGAVAANQDRDTWED
ncbi:hypothetical protein SAMN05216428_102328 [Nitrosospira sp. Nsp11]|uniref:hypothetical protein n=1 Tax=Nitrosospira sp. Nsp11 TaxID=1855338 RepID=UPI00091B3BC5|nr:hypothetical protein [Nitrosospira sp. Nsp11]SHL41436.1 hypothetical protein SAMN05216428_102328 [Nitrosospira sp. Nsp11]